MKTYMLIWLMFMINVTYVSNIPYLDPITLPETNRFAPENRLSQ